MVNEGRELQLVLLNKNHYIILVAVCFERGRAAQEVHEIRDNNIIEHVILTAHLTRLKVTHLFAVCGGWWSLVESSSRNSFN